MPPRSPKSDPTLQKEVPPLGLWDAIDASGTNTFAVGSPNASIAIHAVLDPLSKKTAYLAPVRLAGYLHGGYETNCRGWG